MTNVGIVGVGTYLPQKIQHPGTVAGLRFYDVHRLHLTVSSIIPHFPDSVKGILVFLPHLWYDIFCTCHPEQAA